MRSSYAGERVYACASSGIGGSLMLNVAAYGFLYGGGVTRERLTRARLDHAHAAAAAILSGSRRGEPAFWTRYALNFMVGAATPLRGECVNRGVYATPAKA